MQQSYNADYFGTLDFLFNMAGNNEAYDLLRSECERINGYFQPNEVQLFEGLCKFALESKRITQESYMRNLPDDSNKRISR